jgi:hypothetical protein
MEKERLSIYFGIFLKLIGKKEKIRRVVEDVRKDLLVGPSSRGGGGAPPPNPSIGSLA